MEEKSGTENGIFAFWDLIAQEAYLPASEYLKGRTFEEFMERENRKRVWLFGCNMAAETFIAEFRDTLQITGVLDNAKAKQGNSFCGVQIFDPEKITKELMPDQDVILIAMRLNADKIAEQLNELGFFNYYSLGVLLSGVDPYKSFIRKFIDISKKEPLKNIVLMESLNDFDGNAGALFEYLRRRGSDACFAWILKNETSPPAYMGESDLLLYPDRSVEDLKSFVQIRAAAKWEIWECDPIKKVRPDQINVFLQHYGMGYKQVARLYNSPDYVDYALTTTPFVHEMEKNSILYAPHTRFLYGELPRNDVFVHRNYNELAKITGKRYCKTVMWAPTLRESARFHRVDSDIAYPYGISMIYSQEQMMALNDFLEEEDMLLIIKIHPRQKLNYTDDGYSNILYLDGESVRRLHPYKLLTQMDAMLTDYSSIVFDYMLLDRPIAWVLEDRAHYKIEYLMDNPMEYMPGEKIYSMEDLFRFLTQIKEGEDPYRDERRKICARCNPPMEGKGCERLAEALGL